MIDKTSLSACQSSSSPPVEMDHYDIKVSHSINTTQKHSHD